MSNFECYLFDLDGTLADTSKLVLQSLYETICRYTNVRPIKNILKAYIKQSPKRTLRKYGVNDLSIYWQIYDNNIALAKFYFDDTKKILQKLIEKDSTLGVVSSLPEKQIAKILARLSINDLFDTIIGWRFGTRKKPHPDPILDALKETGAEAEKTVYIGDTGDDVIAAKNAGVCSVFVTWSHPVLPYNVEPDFIIDHISELISI